MNRLPRAAALIVLIVGVLLALWTARSKTGRPGTPSPRQPDEAAPPSRPAPSPAVPPRRRTEATAEAQLMARLRQLAAADPEAAVALARDGNRRFGQSAQAAERTSILIHALATLGRSSDARGEAETMVNELPDSPWVREIERFTGAHRHRSVSVTDGGAIEFR
jgi:hypothetical protein